MTAPAIPTIPPGTPVGRYRIDAALGAGATGTVYRATEPESARTVALKVLHPEAAQNPVLVRRLWREAKAAVVVKHPGIVRILDAFDYGGAPVLVMEYLEGESFEELLERRKALPLAELAPIMVQVTAAVGAAHALGIVHRDLKPGNILLRPGPTGLGAKVLDFGVAKLTASEGVAMESVALTTQGMLMGTPYYMSPEQAMGEGDVDPRADIWALGIIIYQALSGVLPTYGKGLGQVFRKVVRGAIPPIAGACPGLPADVAHLVTRMLAVQRDDRPRDLGEVYATMARYVPGG